MFVVSSRNPFSQRGETNGGDSFVYKGPALSDMHHTHVGIRALCGNLNGFTLRGGTRMKNDVPVLRLIGAKSEERSDNKG